MARGIFISYACVDDKYDPNYVKCGWVTALLNQLKIKLAQKLGRESFFDVWQDLERLTHHDSLTDQIVDAVRESDTLVIILSQGYLSSEWCGKELREFLKAHGSDARNRVFVVERDEAA